MLRAERSRGGTVLTQVAHKAPVRLLPLRTTKADRAGAAWCCVSGYGGGFVGGDEVDMSTSVGRDATLLITSQASQKIYCARNAEALAKSDHKVTVDAGGLVVMATDPVTPFRKSRYEQRQQVTLSEGASAVMVDCVTAGRSIRVSDTERWTADRFLSRTEFKWGGASRPSLVETMNLDSPVCEGSYGFDCDGVRRDAAVTLVAAGPRAAEVRAAMHNAAAALTARSTRVSPAALDPNHALPKFGDSVLAGVSDVRGDVTVMRATAERTEDAVRLLRHCLAPLETQLGTAPYADRLHADGGRAATFPEHTEERPVVETPPPEVCPMTPEQIRVASQLTDATLPTGGFAHSGGVEAAHQLGLLETEEALSRFVAASARTFMQLHVPFCRSAYRVRDAVNPMEWFRQLDGDLDAMLVGCGPQQRSSKLQGSGLLRVLGLMVAGRAGEPFVKSLRQSVLQGETPGHISCVFGVAASLLGLPEEAAVQAFVYTSTRDMISAAVRLNVVGPLRGSTLLRDLLSRTAALPAVNDIGDAASTSPLVDCVHATHDLLDTRLFQT
eukprot:TRINITY_DN32281_c0_g1_i1.p1 TRINITY_DN32281_c0_g1~~TRINITY_DN32281_c0_g1_i1.p1  ORF type:complete len:579 (+),score=121.24 TRINITY_DN32281_c0_g1_i1:71-1738(+)